MPIQLNCPKCPQHMEFSFTTSDGKVSVYHCRVHGEWHLGEGGLRPPGEILPRQDLTEPAGTSPLGSGRRMIPSGMSSPS